MIKTTATTQHLNSPAFCTECGAPISLGHSCRESFNQMLAWDFQDPAGAGRLHHLTVLCYNLQHPSVYPPEALVEAKQMLTDFLVNNVSAKVMLAKQRQRFSSKNRDWKVKGSSERFGSYPKKISWTMTASDVVMLGLGSYPESVSKWAKTIFEELKLTQ